VTYGMVMGSVRCGLGTDNPVGPSIPGPSLYYQGLHAYSAFDWEFQEQLLRGCDAGALPADTVIIAGRFPDSFVDSFTNEHLEEVATAQRIACTLAPSLSPFAFRLLEEEDLSLCADASGPTFAPKVRDALWQGSKAKLEAIAEVACATESEDLERKLSTMASAFMPLSTVFGASFNAEDPSKSFTRLAVYLPALHMLHAEDVDTPSSWHLERGFESVALPSPVQVSAARVTHLSYLSCADKTREQGIKFEVRRHFDEPQQVTMVVSFGRLFSKDSDDVLGMDCSDHRDAPYLHLHGHVPP
ncbi:MAG: hypothetical protein GY811_27495, partial [Myxococcales bacterium]|nr:hypothetical protein [Myxococcales bacterium]